MNPVCTSSQGVPVVQVGSPAKPWHLTASIYSDSTGGDSNLLGNITLPFIDGWVNYTNLAIDVLASNVILQFSITYPNTSEINVMSAEFDVEPREFYGVVVESPIEVFVGESFELVLEIRDAVTSDIPDGFYEKVNNIMSIGICQNDGACS